MQIKILIYFVIPKICGLLADFTFTILHDNDAHGRFGRTTVTSSLCPDHIRRNSCVGGFARAAHVIREQRRAVEDGMSPPVVYLTTGGDNEISSGERWYQVHRWKILGEMMNAVRPDAMTLGVQESKDSQENVKQFVQDTDFPIVMTHGNFSSTKKLQGRIRKSYTLKIGGKEVGIIGYTAEFVQKNQPGSMLFPDELASIREESERLVSEKVDIIIALSSVSSPHNEQIVKYLPLVDIFIGGHSNSLLYTGSFPSSKTPGLKYPRLVLRENGREVPIAHGFATYEYIGFLNVTFDDRGNLKICTGNPIYLSNAIPQEEDVLKKVNKYRSKKSVVNDRVIGMGKVLLEGGEKCRKEECILGNLVADALVAMLAASTEKSHFWTTHSIGLVNGGSIKFSIDPRNRDGKITYGDVLKAFPAESEVVKFSIRGKHLKEVFEDIFKDDEPKEILQVSGLQITFDLEELSGKRVVRMKARCGNCQVPVYENVADKSTYNIVTTDRVLNNHDSFRKNHFNRKNVEHDSRESVVWYIAAHSPVFIEIEGRITFNRGEIAEFHCTLPFIYMIYYIICTQYF